MKYHWYYFTYSAECNKGFMNGSYTMNFSDRIEGPNFRNSLNVMRKGISERLGNDGFYSITGATISDLFYIGHFEKMDEVKG